jgi:hypothetical protein
VARSFESVEQRGLDHGPELHAQLAGVVCVGLHHVDGVELLLGSTQKVVPAAPDQPYSPTDPGCAESPSAVRTSKPSPKPKPGGRPGRAPV